ncbi:unnamed protein product [Effrenium voratum]|nr:unnamed protein product [Effrenium voratum]
MPPIGLVAGARPRFGGLPLFPGAPREAGRQGSGLGHGFDHGSGPLRRGHLEGEHASEYIGKASPDFVEALRALTSSDVRLAVATNSDPLEYDLPGQSSETHILGPDLAAALIKHWCPEALDKFEVMVGIDPDLPARKEEEKLPGKSRHMRVIAEHYKVPFSQMLLIDDSARNLNNTDGWQGRMLVREPSVGFRFADCGWSRLSL